MQIKKYPDAKLDNYSRILVLLGLVLSLFIVYEFMIIKSTPGAITELTSGSIRGEDVEQTIAIKPTVPKLEPVAQVASPVKIIKVENEVDVVETILESTETDEMEAIEPVERTEVFVAVEEEEEIEEDVPFIIIERVPVYPGCSGSNAQLRQCFSKNISYFVSKRFNADMAADLGLESGSVQRIFVIFNIDKEGNVTKINARAPHKKLKEEAIRVIRSLPKMEPGKQRGKAVSVKYSLPIVFKVEQDF